MIYKIIIIALLILLPSALYCVWYVSQNQRALARGDAPLAFGEGPWGWLATAGAVLALLVAVFFETTKDPIAEGIYVPPHYENNVYVPGHYKPATPSEAAPQKDDKSP